MRFLKKNYKQLKSIENQINDSELPSVIRQQTDSGINDITYGGSNAEEIEQEAYDSILPMKMKSYQPEINDAGSFAKDLMPPLGNVRASIGSYSNSKNTNKNDLMTPKETGGD